MHLAMLDTLSGTQDSKSKKKRANLQFRIANEHLLTWTCSGTAEREFAVAAKQTPCFQAFVASAICFRLFAGDHAVMQHKLGAPPRNQHYGEGDICQGRCKHLCPQLTPRCVFTGRQEGKNVSPLCKSALSSLEVARSV